VAGLAHPVDEGGRADSAFLVPEILIELEQLGIESGKQPVALGFALFQGLLDIYEFLRRAHLDLFQPLASLCLRGLERPPPALHVFPTFHLLDQQVLGPRSAALQVANLGLDRLELPGVRHGPVDQPAPLRFDLPLKQVHVTLQTRLLLPDGVHGQAQFAESGLGLGKKGASSPKVVSPLELVEPRGRPVDGDVQTLKLEQPADPAGLSRRLGLLGVRRRRFRIHDWIASHTDSVHGPPVHPRWSRSRRCARMASEVTTMTNGSYPARLDLQAPLEVKNWRPLVNWILAIPHLIVLYGLRVLRSVLLLIAFFAVLFTKRVPESIFNMIVMTRRYAWRVTAFALWMRESYPPFDFTATAQDDGIDPASVSIDYPSELNRWMPLVKWLLAIPHYIVLLFLGIGVVFVIILSFFIVLFTGKWPESFRSFVIGTQRWSLRVGAYVLFLRDEYPPFSFEDGGPARPVGGVDRPFPGEAPPPPPGGPQGPAVPPPPPPA
jgi:roadblock/LC7 domain-containing protein